MTQLKKALDSQILSLTKAEKAYFILTLGRKLFENNKNQHWVSMETNPTYYNISNQFNTCLSKINDEKVSLLYCYNKNDNQNWQYAQITKQIKSKIGQCLNYEKIGEDNMINLKKCDIIDSYP